LKSFLPGYYYYSKDEQPVKWYNRDWEKFDAVANNPASIDDLREALEKAVHRQLMSDVPYGVLLSGGLDSSIISAVAKKFASKRIETGDTQQPGGHSCTRLLLAWLVPPTCCGTQSGRCHWHSSPRNHFSVQEGIDAIRDVDIPSRNL
jgi:asparagine synthase (glutamine-hydrolysing)